MPTPEQVDEVMEELDELHVSDLSDFLKHVREKSSGIRRDLLLRIRELVATGKVTLEVAYAFLDKLREHGRQHLFLFKIQEAHRGELATLRGKHTPFVTSLPDKPPAPVLTELRETQTHLLFRWIETRTWEQAIQGAANGEPRVERSINFFRLNLETGEAEIRIQRTRPNCELSPIDELRIYRQMLKPYVDLDHFTAVVLDPAMRRLLTAKRMTVVRWQIDWPESRGRLGGNVDPGFVQSLLLRLANYFALDLAGDWLFARGRDSVKRVRASLDGVRNEVLIPNRCTAEEEAVILADIRGGRRDFRIRQLADVARNRDELRPALEMFDRQFATYRNRDVVLDTVEQEWVAGPQSVTAARELAGRYPELFRIRYGVRCPDNEKAVEHPLGEPYWSDRAEDIPAQISCAHSKKKTVVHATEGQVEAVLSFKPPEKAPPLVPRLTKYAERWLPDGMERQIAAGFTIVLFALVYVPLLVGTAWAFLQLRERFDSNAGLFIIVFTFLVALVFETGIFIVVLGNPIADAAANLLIKLASLLKPAAAFKESDVAMTNVNRVNAPVPAQPQEPPPPPVVPPMAPVTGGG
jgi:hypothetical protein